jgi:large subunit ribosomal protein L14e
MDTWNATPWAKKLAVKAKRASLSDFDRFKVMVAKKQRSQIVGDKLRSISA